MACRGPDHIYLNEQLREIINCTDKVAQELLAESKNDLIIAVEKYFARDIEGDSEKDKDRFPNEHNSFNNKVVDDKKQSDESIVSSRPRLRKKSSIIDLNRNRFSFEDIDAEESILEEVVAISIAEHYPDLDMGTIKYMVRQFKGRQDELLNYLEREVPYQHLEETIDKRCEIEELKADSEEYYTVRDEFLRMIGNRENLCVSSIFIVRNERLENKFEMEQLRMKSQGFSDLASLLFPVTYSPDVEEEVMQNNFKMTVVEMGYFSTKLGVLFTETPKVPEVTMLPDEENHLMMCLVLAGDSVVDREGSIIVTSVDKILPKYVVHFSQKRCELDVFVD